MHFLRTGFGRENSFAIATWQQKSQIITNRTIQTADLVRFRVFSPQMCLFQLWFFSHRLPLFWPYSPGPAVRLLTIGEYVSQPSFNWLLSWCFFLYRTTHITIVCRPRVWPTGDVAPQCVNKQIFLQSICAVCVYVGNLLAENRKWQEC